MLCSAFDNDSHSVTLDLLTSEDLEALRSATGLHPTTAKQEVSQAVRSKRYLILTYHGEFDKVHYPMALTFSDIEDVPELKRTIVRLRDELDQLRRSPINHQSSHELERILMASQSERDALARELQDYSVENGRLHALVETLKAENHSLRLRGEKPGSSRRADNTPTSTQRKLQPSGHTPIHRRGTNSNIISRMSSRGSSPVHSARGATSKSPRVSRSAVGAASMSRHTASTKSPRTRSIPGLPPGYHSPYAQLQARSPAGSTTTSPRNIERYASPSRRSVIAEDVSRSVPRKVRSSSIAEPSRGASLSEVDARLQALQNFLRNQKLRSGVPAPIVGS
jgi:hypothetical protein